MFGNLQGWIISLVMIVMTVGLIVWKGSPAERSKPTGGLKAAMVSADVKPDPDALIPVGTKDQDAGEIYRQLAASVKEKRRQYDEFQKIPAGPKRRAAMKNFDKDMEMLLAAGDCNRMTLFKAAPEEVVNYKNSKPLLSELQQVGTLSRTIAGMLIVKDDANNYRPKPADIARGTKLFMASFHLGRFLADERVTFDEYRIGVDLMSNAAGMLAKFGDVDPAKKDALEMFSQQISLERYLPAVQVITGVPEETKMVAMPGDIFELALNSQEPMWQTEAILKLGRMRYMRGVKGADQRDANKVVAELAARTDVPANVKAAAVAARDLTIEQFRMIGGGS